MLEGLDIFVDHFEGEGTCTFCGPVAVHKDECPVPHLRRAAWRIAWSWVEGWEPPRVAGGRGAPVGRPRKSVTKTKEAT